MKIERIKKYIKIKMQHLPKDLEMQILAENGYIDYSAYSKYIDKKILKRSKEINKRF